MYQFYFTIKDNDNKTYDVHGPITNDEKYVFMVSDAQENGFNITCNSSPADKTTEESVCKSMEGYGFKRDYDLFEKVELMGMKGSRPD